MHWMYLHGIGTHKHTTWHFCEKVSMCEPVYTHVPISDQSVVPWRCRYQQARAAFQWWPCRSACNAARLLIGVRWRPALPNGPGPPEHQPLLHAACSACTPLLPPHPSQNKSSAAAHREYHFIFYWPLVFLGLFSIFYWVISHRVKWYFALFFSFLLISRCKTGAVF